MNSEKWFALFALILQNMPALQAIFKKDKKEVVTNATQTSETKQG